MHELTEISDLELIAEIERDQQLIAVTLPPAMTTSRPRISATA
jgi:hypothetical protein